MKRLFTILLFFCFLSAFAQQSASVQPDDKRMEWFGKAKLGIFIHWGIYAVNGIDESWSFYNNYISHADYMKQLDGFTASAYQTADWASLIRESGSKYAVITTKPHDGVSLWDTRCNELSVVKKTPAARDLISPFVKELHKQGVKAGLYFSLLDWSHPDYPNFTRTQKRYENDSIRWNSFMNFEFCQLNELNKQFKPDLYWFDGDWEQTAQAWKAPEIRTMLLHDNPGVIFNSRLQGYGDYATPEQGLPLSKPKDNYWELCMTINDSWGYQGNDHEYKTPGQIIRLFTECIGMGGNLLLDIGPMPDGTIPAPQVATLKELGRWAHKHAEAVYETRAGIAPGYFYGPTALSSDSTILYLYLHQKPNGPVALKGVKNKINRIWVVGNGTKLEWQLLMKPYWSQIPGIVYIDVPDKVLDPEVTVIAVLLDGKIRMQVQ
jgi:alpha-L-fucosidase